MEERNGGMRDIWGGRSWVRRSSVALELCVNFFTVESRPEERLRNCSLRLRLIIAEMNVSATSTEPVHIYICYSDN